MFALTRQKSTLFQWLVVPLWVADLAAPGGKVDHVSISYNAGHPGVPDPHYHIILWQIPKAEEQLVAK